MFKKGDRIELVEMPDDPNPIPVGTRGTVIDSGPVDLGSDNLMDTFIFHHDAGHGWLAVPIARLWALGRKLSEFTECSHIGIAGTPLSKLTEDTVFLEEDTDAIRFLKELPEESYDVVEVHDGDHSPIRKMFRNIEAYQEYAERRQSMKMRPLAGTPFADTEVIGESITKSEVFFPGNRTCFGDSVPTTYNLAQGVINDAQRLLEVEGTPQHVRTDVRPLDAPSRVPGNSALGIALARCPKCGDKWEYAWRKMIHCPDCTKQVEFLERRKKRREAKKNAKEPSY